MTLTLVKLEVGPWPMNTYIIVCENTGKIAIVDPGAEADKILQTISKINIPFAGDKDIKMIFITHGHPDHIGSLDEVRDVTAAPVYMHPLDADLFDVECDFPFPNDGILSLGQTTIQTIHTPGHTPGSTCINLCDSRVIVGDTIFVGGPGKTLSAPEFNTTMNTMKSIVFNWSDDTEFFPGHGPHGRIGDERPKYNSFVTRGWKQDLYGDVTWG